jgi:hypothetical protein
MPVTTIAAGSHDLDRPSIAGHSINEMIVAQHELHHDIALTETNFGFIQSTFRRVHATPASQRVRESIGDWTDHFLDHSRITHEALATYLSIKQQPYQVCPSLVDQLPEEYRDYYRRLADLIDAILPSTFLQFMVGKIVIEICFSSRLIEKMLSWIPEQPPLLDDVDSPDKRFEALAPIWNERLPDLRQLLAQQCPVRNFDILSEAAWIALPYRSSRQVDDWLDIACRDWMYPIACSLTPCSTRVEWFRQRNEFTQHMNGFTSVPMQLYGTEAEFETDHGYAARRALRAGRVLVSNPVTDLPKFEKIEAAAFVALMLGSKQGADAAPQLTNKWNRATLISPEPSPTQRDGDWTAFLFDDENCVAAYDIDRDAVKRFSRTLTRLATLGGPIPHVRTIVGLWASDSGNVDTSSLNEIIEAYSFPSFRLRLENPIWYMGGSFLTFYNALLAKGGLEGFYTNPFQSAPSASQLSLEQFIEMDADTSFEETSKLYTQVATNPLFFIFRSPVVEGWFVRIVPAGSIDALLVVGEDIVARKVRLFSRSEMETAWNLISGIDEPIVARWPRF